MKYQSFVIPYRKTMERAAGRCQLCKVCEGATGYYYGSEGNFRALSKADRPVALQTLRDLKMEQVDLDKIKLFVTHFDGDMTNLKEENLLMTCRRCQNLIVTNRRSHEKG